MCVFCLMQLLQAEEMKKGLDGTPGGLDLSVSGLRQFCRAGERLRCHCMELLTSPEVNNLLIIRWFSISGIFICFLTVWECTQAHFPSAFRPRADFLLPEVEVFLPGVSFLLWCRSWCLALKVPGAELRRHACRQALHGLPNCFTF